jgi:hypothetical protein
VKGKDNNNALEKPVTEYLESTAKAHNRTNAMNQRVPFFLAGAVLIATLVCGCNTVSVSSKQYLGVASYPATDPTTIQILQTQPTMPHIRLGEITLQPQGNPTKADMEQKLRLAAAHMGANAVVIVADQTMVFGTTVMGPWWGRTISPDVGRVIVGVAIRYTR